MAAVKASLPHEDRTAAEPRDAEIHQVLLERIEPVNESIKVFRLKIEDQKRGIKFYPGQWLDTIIPGLPSAGGFTLTSTPMEASPMTNAEPYLELAVQKSPGNPPAAWLWRPEHEILGKRLLVRVGGSFVWPPPSAVIEKRNVQRAVFIAGGVGINPLVSMLSSLHQARAMPPHVEFLYSTKTDAEIVEPSRILFLPRLIRIQDAWPKQLDLTLFLTGKFNKLGNPVELPWHYLRRIEEHDLENALGELETRQRTVCYVCGPPAMTDAFVKFLGEQKGMDQNRVFCEKWW